MFEWFDRHFRSAYLQSLEAQIRAKDERIASLEKDNRELMNTVMREAGARVDLGNVASSSGIPPQYSHRTWDRYASKKEFESAKQAAENAKKIIQQVPGLSVEEPKQ